MTRPILDDLRNKGFISENQYVTLESIINRRIFPVFYELRTLLYLGVMLFTTGVGFLIYQNIGDLGHVLAITTLSLLSIGCLAYALIKGKPFSKNKVESPNPYFDYVLLLGCLLFVSVFGYLQFQFEFLEDNARGTSLVTAVLFMFFAYRLDHLGVLSLAITALASFFGIVVSLNDLSSLNSLYNVGIVFSLFVSTTAIILERQAIKPHFTFTYLNFCALIFYASVLAGVFDSRYTYLPYLILLLAGSGLGIWLANWKKSFLFLLYAVIAAYIGITYALSEVADWDILGWLFYMILSCGGFIFFLVRYRNYFKRKE